MSKFAGLRRSSEQREVSTIQTFDNSKVQLSSPSVAMPTLQPGKKLGRPTAKRSNPEFRQVTCYVRKDTYKSVRARLLVDEREFSELVQELLDSWLGKQ